MSDLEESTQPNGWPPHGEGYLSQGEAEALLDDWILALDDYGLLTAEDTYDKTAFYNEETARWYRDLLHGLPKHPSLEDVADLITTEPKMVPAIKQYCRYPMVTSGDSHPRAESTNKGKGRQLAHDLGTTPSAAPDPSETEKEVPLTKAAHSCKRLLRMIELRNARQRALGALLEGERTTLENYFACESSAHQFPPAIVLRSVLREETSLVVGGEHVGCLFTYSHASLINDVKDACLEIVDNGAENSDGKKMSQWIKELYGLFHQALATPDDEFLGHDDVCEGDESSGRGGEGTSLAEAQLSGWFSDDVSPQEIERMFAARAAADDKEKHTSGGP